MIGYIAICDRCGIVIRVIRSIPIGIMNEGRDIRHLFTDEDKLDDFLRTAPPYGASVCLRLKSHGSPMVNVTVKTIDHKLLFLVYGIDDLSKLAPWMEMVMTALDAPGMLRQKPHGDEYYEIQKLNSQLINYQRELAKTNAQLQIVLRESERANRAKSEFLSHMSHDIRTPMNAIIGMTNIALDNVGNAEKVTHCLESVRRSSDHLLGLINDVLDMSRIESGNTTLNLTLVSLPELMSSVMSVTQMNISSKEQRFIVSAKNIVHEYYRADGLRLRQILINILSNASKFTPIGGTVSFSIEERPGNTPAISTLHIAISDTGIGMSPEFIGQIFNPFSREKDSRVDSTEGTGLGMAITKKLVDLMGGAITVRSAPGQGTAFDLALPLQIDAAQMEQVRFPHRSILVAESDEGTRSELCSMLGEMGFTSFATTAGEDFLAQIGIALRAGRPFDAAILDRDLDGMDGLQTVRKLREQGLHDLPVLLLSACDWSGDEDALHALGIRGVIQKPVFRSTLRSGIQQYILGEQSKQTAAPIHDFNNKRFLVIEDVEVNREIATILLERVGAQVETAVNGQEGLVKFEAASDNFYSAVLMDIQMPVMNGLAAARGIRSLNKQDAGTVPIVAMSADAFAEDVQAAKRAGMNGHIAKPIDVDTLYHVLDELMAGKTPQAEFKNSQ